mgnify:CR=1 FL=1
MKIFSAAFGPHDHNTYDGVWHNQRERYTRRKHNIPWHFDAYPHHSTADKMNQSDDSAGRQFYDEYWKPDEHEIFAFTTTGGGIEQIPSLEVLREDIDWHPNGLWDYKILQDNLYYIDHHQSHAAYAYLLSGYKESDILAIDGRGSKYNCIFIDKDDNITDLSNEMNLGIMWNWFAKQLGFGNLGASKVMGLAAYGQYDDAIALILEDYWNGHKLEWQSKNRDFNQFFIQDIAHTLQVVTEDRIRDYVFDLKSCDNICVAGGVAYNGYMNEMLYENWSSVYVPPAPGDEGQSIGTYMHADYTLNKNVHKPSVYAGKEYEYVGEEKVDYTEVAQAIADGKIVGWFQGKSESGHRALGNRSILADPRNSAIKDIINGTIKNREDFRPFAPSVLEDYYQEWFDTPEPSPYMSRIMKVKNDKVPGITHLDGTARIQTVNREQNEKYYDLINEFYKITGVPMVLNTSFNCQEPIVETPEEAINTFNKTDMDLLVINDYILRKMG